MRKPSVPPTATPADDAWAESAGVHVAEALAEAAGRSGSITLALAGGSSPAPVYRWLAAAGGVPWDRVEIYFGDERCVPPGAAESNYHMARETLLEPAGIPDRLVHRMEAEREDRDAAAAEYAARLPHSIDILLLGIGTDGHIASLFPGAPALGETERRVVPVDAPGGGLPRLTVTPPVVEAARRIYVLARGSHKADAVARALEGDWAPETCPAQLARRGTWLLDPEASLSLGGTRAAGRTTGEA